MIGNLVNLESLDVSKNVISELPNNIRHCRSLSVIEASVTKIEKYAFPVLGSYYVQHSFV